MFTPRPKSTSFSSKIKIKYGVNRLWTRTDVFYRCTICEYHKIAEPNTAENKATNQETREDTCLVL